MRTRPPETMKDNSNNKKVTKWVRLRHRIIRDIAWVVFCPFLRLKYRVKIRELKGSRGKQYLLLYNHQTPMDQFFVGMTVREPVYYLASEDIFTKGFLSGLMKYAVAPIPIRKQAMDIKAVINCMRVAKEGGSIAIAPEGNRTYSGRTGYIAPSIAPLARKLGLPIAFVRIDGGWGVQPRWSDVIRRGGMRAGITRVMAPEEYAALSDGELAETIRRELYTDENRTDRVFRSKKSAEYLERAIYVCPDCGFAEWESLGDTVTCKKCGTAVRFRPDTSLEGVEREFPFRSVGEWYDHQCDFVNGTDTEAYTASPVFCDTADMYGIAAGRKAELIRKAVRLFLYGDRIELEQENGERTVWSLDELTGAVVLGRNKLNLYVGGEIRQFRGSKRFNALKYVNFYYRRKNQVKGSENGEFLGL